MQEITTNFSEAFKYWLILHQMSYTDFANKYNSSPQYIRELATKETVSNKVLGKVVKALNMSVDRFWKIYPESDLAVQMQQSEQIEHLEKIRSNEESEKKDPLLAKYLSKSIPFYNSESLEWNGAALMQLDAQPTHFLHVPGFSDCIAIQFSGDSMEPLYKPNDILLIKEVSFWKKWIDWGQVYYILTLEQQIVKYVWPGDNEGYWTLKTYNEKYPDSQLPLDIIERVFLVKGIIRQDNL